MFEFEHWRLEEEEKFKQELVRREIEMTMMLQAQWRDRIADQDQQLQKERALLQQREHALALREAALAKSSSADPLVEQLFKCADN